MRRPRSIAAIFGATSLALIAQPALAWDFSVHGAHVTLVQPPGDVAALEFQIDTAAGTCAAGSFLTWTVAGSDEPTQIANTSALISLLLTALVGNRPVDVYGFNSGCTVNRIHIE